LVRSFSIPSLGAYYNYSEGFTPNNLTFPTIYGVFGNDPTVAHSKAAGLRFRLFEGKLVGSAGYYQSREGNKPGGFSTGTINQIWVDLGQPAKQIAGGGVTQYYDTSAFSARGLEFDMTANVSRELRFIFNLALPKAQQTDAFLASRAYYAANLATWQAGANDVNNPNASRIAQGIASFKSTLDGNVDGRELNGAFKYRANIYGNYTFQSGPLKNVAFGGGANLYGRRLIGNPAGLPFNYIYNDSYYVVAGTVSYSLKVRNLPVRISLNVDNLLDNKDPQYTGVAGFNGATYKDTFCSSTRGNSSYQPRSRSDRCDRSPWPDRSGSGQVVGTTIGKLLRYYREGIATLDLEVRNMGKSLSQPWQTDTHTGGSSQHGAPESGGDPHSAPWN
jgi:hypothetical protein